MNPLLLLLSFLVVGDVSVLDPQAVDHYTLNPLRAIFLKFDAGDFNDVMSPPPGSLKVAKPVVGHAEAIRFALVPSIPTTRWSPELAGKSWWALFRIVLLFLVGLILSFACIGSRDSQSRTGAVVGSLLFVGYGALIVMFLRDHAELEFASDLWSDILWTLMLIAFGALGVIVPLAEVRIVVSEHPPFVFLRVLALITVAGFALFALVRGTMRDDVRLFIDNATGSSYSVGIAGQQLGVWKPKTHAIVILCVGAPLHKRAGIVPLTVVPGDGKGAESYILRFSHGGSYIFNIAGANAYQAESATYR